MYLLVLKVYCVPCNADGHGPGIMENGGYYSEFDVNGSLQVSTVICEYILLDN